MLRTADYIAEILAKLPEADAERDLVAVFPTFVVEGSPLGTVVAAETRGGVVETVVYDVLTMEAHELFREPAPSIDRAIAFAMDHAGYEV